MENWLSYYDWVLGPDGPHPKPNKDILDDDEALDDFIDNWKRDLEKGGRKKDTKSFNIG